MSTEQKSVKRPQTSATFEFERGVRVNFTDRGRRCTSGHRAGEFDPSYAERKLIGTVVSASYASVVMIGSEYRYRARNQVSNEIIVHNGKELPGPDYDYPWGSVVSGPGP